ncbi:polysaccharide deacetylase family protein [Ktedonobacter racemifer]|uniref:Polysaccharide deacetylase n=1 Tax=Ktedonobacter racemifer DSM 44963 TaxID=485913 RepID=D6TLU3_KTERA|nr:polysaccharide deacetylase family protein [Ktedonobacter racemifer]EFH86743.1 polysaccharide deacetylase [Ktedonobacter racemifer DSM 44963]
MNLVSFSIKTKGPRNFARRLWTVFSRFGFSETRNRRSLETLIHELKPYQAAPTFFIPAVVLQRHPRLLADIEQAGAEIGIHGYVHNDYRQLNKDAQYTQTSRAIATFQQVKMPFQGFRNPYLGWSEDSVQVFTDLGFAYESNEAVLHDVVDQASLSPTILDGYQKSLALYRALPCTAYALRPHFEDTLLRIPTSIPDDEMLFDRLRITSGEEVGKLWSLVMQRVYDLEGAYVLNLHPERGVLCRQALSILLRTATSQPRPIWITRLDEIARWWKERARFTFTLQQTAPNAWQVEADCTERATILARHVQLVEQPTTTWNEHEVSVEARTFTLEASQCPAIGVSPETPEAVLAFLHEQGYAAQRASEEERASYTHYLHLPTGLGASRSAQFETRSDIIQQVEGLTTPLLRFACWPSGHQAALSISGDIDSVTIQDFFLRILEVG